MGGLIDFKQVATQIVGFLIFLWLIRKYAWGPVLETLEQRRAKIVGDLAHAEQEKLDAAALKADLDRQLKGIEAQARQKIQEAVSEGQKMAADIKADAQGQARARLERAEADIQTERLKAQKALQEDVARMAVWVTVTAARGTIHSGVIPGASRRSRMRIASPHSRRYGIGAGVSTGPWSNGRHRALDATYTSPNATRNRTTSGLWKRAMVAR